VCSKTAADSLRAYSVAVEAGQPGKRRFGKQSTAFFHTLQDCMRPRFGIYVDRSTYLPTGLCRRRRTFTRSISMRIRDLNWHNSIPRLFVVRERCPLCLATKFNLSARHPLRLVLRCVAIRPVRCASCWRRFYWLKPGRIHND
jgi:hypothetical protein